MRLQYVLSEIATGLRRNLTMTLAVIITVAISMSFLGTGLLLRAQADTMTDYWYDKVEVSFFLCNEFDTGTGCEDGEVSADQQALIEQTLEAHPEVRAVFFESQDEAYELYSTMDQSTADFIVPAQLQKSYRVALTHPDRSEGVKSAVGGLPGVHSIQDQRDLLEPFFGILNAIQLAAIVVAVLLVVAAILLIANTIRLAAFSRRRETGIMRLVGASNFYIQLPFILEAAIAGLIGAVLACSGVVLVKALLIDRSLTNAVRFTTWVDWSDTLQILPMLLITGVVLSSVSATITLRRYLRV